MTKADVYGAELLRTMNTICQIAGQASVDPMLNEVLVKAEPEREGGVVSFYSTDMSVALEKRLGCDFIDETGEEVETPEGWSIVVQAKQLQKIAKLFGKLQSVYLQPVAPPDGAPATWFQIEGVLHTGKVSKHKIVGLPAEEFPPMPEYDAGVLQDVAFPVLAEAIRKIIPSMVDNDARKYLNGGLIDISDEKQMFVATDSHTLAFVDTDIGYTGTLKSGYPDDDVIVPRFTLSMLTCSGVNGAFQVKGKKWHDIPIVQFGVDRKKLIVAAKGVNGEGITLVSALIDSCYPDYKAVIPKKVNYSAEVDTKLLLEALKRASVCADPKTHRLEFMFKNGGSNEIHIIGEDCELGESHEVVDAVIDDPFGELDKQIEKAVQEREDRAIRDGGEGSPQKMDDYMKIDYNEVYLSNAISRIGNGKIRIEWLEPTSGIVLKAAADSKDGVIVMPMGR